MSYNDATVLDNTNALLYQTDGSGRYTGVVGLKNTSAFRNMINEQVKTGYTDTQLHTMLSDNSSDVDESLSGDLMFMASSVPFLIEPRQTAEIVFAFVVGNSLDDLYKTSGFGRALAEALSTSLFKQGFRVAEVRKAPGLYVKSKSGELTLTRDASLLAQQEKVQAIVAGTYSLTPTTVIINVKLLDASTSEVMSVAALEVQRSRNINYLLMEDGGGQLGPLSAYER